MPATRQRFLEEGCADISTTIDDNELKTRTLRRSKTPDSLPVMNDSSRYRIEALEQSFQ